jgi:hypothetical protein
LVAVPHAHPVQVYPKQTFDALSLTPVGAKQNGFADQGLKVTPLHSTSEPDEDIQWATNPPAASVVLTEFDEAAKKAVQMVEDGTTLTPAEEFKEKSDEAAKEEGTLVDEEEEIAAAIKKEEADKKAESAKGKK